MNECRSECGEIVFSAFPTNVAFGLICAHSVAIAGEGDQVSWAATLISGGPTPDDHLYRRG